MYSLLTVNNHISLININVATSTFLIGFVIFLVFLAIYISGLSLRIPRIGVSSLLRSVSPIWESSSTGTAPTRASLCSRISTSLSGQGEILYSGASNISENTETVKALKVLGTTKITKALGTIKTLRITRTARASQPRQHERAATAATMNDPLDPLDPLDASLQDFEPPTSPTLLHSALRSEAPTEDDLEDSELNSVGGYSPPAWRRLGNGDRSSGFWRGPHDMLANFPMRLHERESSPEFDDDSEDDLVLEKAIRTRLPQGSLSPDKGRSVSPERHEDATMRVNAMQHRTGPTTALTLREPPPDNYIRFAVRAEVQQRTEPIEAAINFIRNHYTALTRTWASTFTSLFIAFLSISTFKTLLQPAAPRPAGDLVKVAGVARSFEPLIYYSEHAVAQVHDLQATSVAVWDLGESVRTSDMRDAPSIVADLDALSETMKTLAIEMTKFFARVDGDIDGILNVMDWAKMHLHRLHSSPAPSTLSSAYDNLHNMFSQARILEDASGAPTTLGSVTTYVFGMSNPQREQRMVQLLFKEFLTVLEDSIQSELQHSVTLFALFEAVDFHFLNLARTVVRESSAQEEMHADLLSSLWTRLLGGRAAELRKFEQNRLLLRNVRDKTVRNKGILVEHNGKLLTLKASLETLRSKLVSPLVRGVNSTTLTLEDQIRGLSDVSDYLSDVRRQQKGKVMESLFGSVPGKKWMIEGEGVRNTL
ncbi:Fc.00g039610.m01.CDS01 [Cosmosporella sp. VM-42]